MSAAAARGHFTLLGGHLGAAHTKIARAPSAAPAPPPPPPPPAPSSAPQALAELPQLSQDRVPVAGHLIPSRGYLQRPEVPPLLARAQRKQRPTAAEPQGPAQGAAPTSPSLKAVFGVGAGHRHGSVLLPGLGAGAVLPLPAARSCSPPGSFRERPQALPAEHQGRQDGAQPAPQSCVPVRWHRAAGCAAPGVVRKGDVGHNPRFRADPQAGHQARSGMRFALAQCLQARGTKSSGENGSRGAVPQCCRDRDGESRPCAWLLSRHSVLGARAAPQGAHLLLQAMRSQHFVMEV